MEERLSEAAAAGGRKPAQDVFWGRHVGDRADLDGHLWEIACNTHWTLADDGSLRVPRRA